MLLLVLDVSVIVVCL